MSDTPEWFESLTPEEQLLAEALVPDPNEFPDYEAFMEAERARSLRLDPEGTLQAEKEIVELLESNGGR
jgi:hypothetical protein